MSILTNSDRGSLFLTRGGRDGKYLVSKLFDVTESSTPEQAMHTEANEITVPFGVGIAGNVASSRTPINIKDVYSVSRPFAFCWKLSMDNALHIIIALESKPAIVDRHPEKKTNRKNQQKYKKQNK